ncbi:MAG: lipoyl domain-containing protein [Caldilineaceae bacterium]
MPFRNHAQTRRNRRRWHGEKRWHKRPSEHVDKLEPLLDISTDKIDTEVPSPTAGTLAQIVIVEEGRRWRQAWWQLY